MKNDEKAVIAGVGALLALSFLGEKTEKKINMSDVSISPTEFFEE